MKHTKSIILSLAVVLLAAACSKKESTNASPKAPVPFALTSGDIVSPLTVVPDKIGSRKVYRVPWKLSAAKVAALCKAAQEHPNQEIQIMAGSNGIATVRAPADPRDAAPARVPNLSFQFVSDSKEDARQFAESLREFSQ